MAPKRSRKSQLKELQERKRARKEAEKDPEFSPSVAEEKEELEELEDDVEVPLTEEVGGSSKRRQWREGKRRQRSRLRGVGQLSQFMESWLDGDEGKATPTALDMSKRESISMVNDIVAEVIEKALKLGQDKEEATVRASIAEVERKRYHARKQVLAREQAPRLRRTFSVGEWANSKREGAVKKKQLKKRRTMRPALEQIIQRICKKRRFKREDIINGATLSRVEFYQAKRDVRELSKIYALNIFLCLRREGCFSQFAFGEAAKAVPKADGGNVNWQTVRRWFGQFVEDGGKVQLDQRGRKPSMPSYLQDNAIKEQAIEWIRQQLAVTRAKNIDAPPLTVVRFCDWINGTLLKPALEANPNSKPIHMSTARDWLIKLGFKYKSHAKSIYYDGHERSDVVQDRHEKLVMLAVLAEVTVHFGGKNCNEVIWPLLHPGEPPVIWVSQDEYAFHSKDDMKHEWAEEGRGLSIKQKSRGSLLMVSMFISELHGKLNCTPAQRDAYIQAHPNSVMAEKFRAEPAWNGSSSILIEPGAAAGKDKYFDAEQLMEQTKLAMDVFDATHIAPGRWCHHQTKFGDISRATNPIAFESCWCPPTGCKAMFFYDHSSGHGAYAKEALLVTHTNKGPDWNGKASVMRNGWYKRADGFLHAQEMQFKEGDVLTRPVICPPNLNPNAAPAPTATTAAQQAEAPAPAAAQELPPTDAETAAAFKLYFQGTNTTLKKHNPGKTPAELLLLGQSKWSMLPLARRMVFVGRVRAKATQGPVLDQAQRTIAAGSLVPRALWGRNKGMEQILAERGLLPATGLKGCCQSEQQHDTTTNKCCCSRLLSVQPDFATECSALQHLVERRIPIAGATGMDTKRHICLFLPRFHCELNWIERMWGASKHYVRTHCLYTLAGLRETIPISLTQEVSEVPEHLHGQKDVPVAPVLLQRRWARISRQYMAEYRKGADGSEAILAVKALRSKRHRDTSDARSRAAEASMAEMSNHL